MIPIYAELDSDEPLQLVDVIQNRMSVDKVLEMENIHRNHQNESLRRACEGELDRVAQLEDELFKMATLPARRIDGMLNQST